VFRGSFPLRISELRVGQKKEFLPGAAAQGMDWTR
jgi:hypothetical protein